MADDLIRRALVLGRSTTVWQEMEAAQRLAEFDVIIATKRAGRDYSGPVHHWVSFHPNLFAPWAQERAKKGYPPAEVLWSASHAGIKHYDTHIRWLPNIGGSSGLLAVQVALLDELSIDKVVLCGIPMDVSNRYDSATPWKEALAHRKAWLQYLPKMSARVRSMSGWTREQLGPVTAEWLHSPQSTDGCGEQST